MVAMKLRQCFAGIILLFHLSLSAQYSNVQIGGTINSWFPDEPSICINPKNPDEIVIGANLDNSYISQDGGATWQHEVLTSSLGIYCDPVIISDTSGNFYFFHLVPDMSRLVCQKKAGIQAQWTDGTYTAFDDYKDIDKEWAAFDPVTGNIYVTWSRFDEYGSPYIQDSTYIFLSKSTDCGLSWGDQKLLSNIGGNSQGGTLSVHGSCPATGPDGEVYAVWWSPAGIMFDKSTDEGETWLDTDINVTGFPVTWIYTIPGIELGVSFPVIACDRSGGTYHGTIYVNWADKRGGSNNADIWLVKSTDGGMTWSEPVRVNDDLPGKHQFFNFMTIDQVTGKIYIVFYDRRNYTDQNTDVYAAISDDGGETFTNIKISETPFYPYSTVFFGHYIGISAHNDHVFAAWMRMDSGEPSLWGTAIDPDMVEIAEDHTIPFSISQNSPNPFQEYTFFSFRLSDACRVSLKVLNAFGNNVATLIANEMTGSGKHTVQFFPEKYNLSPGVYYYSLVTNQQTITRKMIYSK
jgi:hypothetical protein